MIRLRYRLYRLASGLRHQVPRRLTPAGMLAFFGAILAGSAGIDMDRTVAYQAFALLACVLSVSFILLRRVPATFSVNRHLPRFASVGQPVQYSIEIQNRTPRAWVGLEVFEDLPDPRPGYAEFLEWTTPEKKPGGLRARLTPEPFRDREFRQATVAPMPIPALPAGGTVRTAMELTPLRRGVLRFESISLARPDPLGLVRAFRRLPAPASLVVLPRRYPLPALALSGGRQYQPGGVALAATVGEAEEFIALRDYRPGDPLRHIHWRSWARAGRPIVREFQDEFLPRHALVLDTFARTSQDDAFEEAVSIAASFACTIETRESLLDLLFVGPQAICFTTGRGLGQAEQALEVLAAVRRRPEGSFDALHHLVLRHAVSVCSCICVFVDWDEPRRELVRQLRARGVPVLALVIRPAQAGGRPGNRGTTKADEHNPGEPGVQFLEVGRIAEGLSRLEGAA